MPRSLRLLLVKFVCFFAFFLTFVSIARAGDSQFFMGINAHLYGLSRPEITKQLDSIKSANLTMVRVDFPWRVVEAKRGLYQIPPSWDFLVDSARNRGIEPLVVLDYGNKFYDNGGKPLSNEAVNAFVAYSKSIVQHFGSKVRFYEIWNEWNGTLGNTAPGSAESYIRLISVTYPALKALEPAATIIAGSTSAQSYQSLVGLPGFGTRQKNAWGFFDRLLDLGILKYADAISIHPYTLFISPKSGVTNSAEGYYKYARSIIARTNQKSGGKTVHFMVSELGWPTSSELRPSFVNEAAQAQYIVQSLILSRTLPQMDSVLLFDIKNGADNSDSMDMSYGLIHRDDRPKPAYVVLQNFTALVGSSFSPAVVKSAEGDPYRWIVSNIRSGTGSANFLWSRREGDVEVKIACASPETQLRASRLNGAYQPLQCNSIVKLGAAPLAIVGTGVTVSIAAR